jgi:hypothetical protein
LASSGSSASSLPRKRLMAKGVSIPEVAGTVACIQCKREVDEFTGSPTNGAGGATAAESSCRSAPSALDANSWRL